MSSGPAIGIDLGTTYTCVGVFQCGKVEIIANDQGYRRTPNYVAFTHRDCLIGDAAKNQLALNPVNTVFDAKRLIGLRFNDAEVQKDMKRWPFRVVNSRGKPMIQVEYCGEIKQFSPEEISSLVLRKAKETAEAYLGEEVKDAVITLPAYFNVSQRQATTYASELAGLNVLRTISEPMAAAIAYGLDKRLNRECNVLIFDLGRESLDVCILSIVNGTFEVKATDGDRHLGGKDFDSRLVDYYVKKFRRQLHGIHSVPSGRTISRLRRSCEAAKRTLSSTYYANVDVESLCEDLDFSTTLSRHFFEQVCMDLFNKLLSPVKRALSGAKLDRTDIDEIVLVGGSTHIPKVQKLLQDFFGGRKLNKSINPEEVVAYGAALLAADLTNSKSKILGVIPPPVGKNNEAAAPPLIKCSKSFPVKQTHTYTTRVDNQTSILIPVYASQRMMARDINLLCNFRLSGIPPAPRGMPQVEVTFDLDENGVLNVSAVEKSIKKQNSITISLETDCSLEDAEKRVLKQEDEKQKSRLVAKNMLENYVFTVISRMNNKEVKQKTSKEFRKNVYAMCGTTFKWLDTDCQATKEDYELMRKRIESICGPIMITERPG